MQNLAQNNHYPLYDAKYQKALRVWRQAEPGDPAVKLSDKSHSFHARRQAKKRVEEQKTRLAEEHFDGNKHALMLTDLKHEQQHMISLLESVDSSLMIETMPKTRRTPLMVDGVNVNSKTPRPKRKITLSTYAEEQSFALTQCSTKAIYKYWPDHNKYEYKHSLRCGRRVCPVCGHFDSLAEKKMLHNELLDRMEDLTPEQRGRGRLMHIVLTHENVEVSRVLDVLKVWRRIQQVKKRTPKNKKNIHSVWNVLLWGLWRWEVTRNPDTGLYHPHLHILAWVDGWLAAEKGGYWSLIVESWRSVCDEMLGLNVTFDAQKAKPVAFWSNSSEDPRAIKGDAREDIARVLTSDDVSEMAKYPVKATDWTKIEQYKKGSDYSNAANELAYLLSLIHGRKLKNGWGGLKLREVMEEERNALESDFIHPEDYTDEVCYEVIFTWDKVAGVYKVYRYREWDEDRFNRYLEDLTDWKNRGAVAMSYGVNDDGG